MERNLLDPYGKLKNTAIQVRRLLADFENPMSQRHRNVRCLEEALGIYEDLKARAGECEEVARLERLIEQHKKKEVTFLEKMLDDGKEIGKTFSLYGDEFCLQILIIEAFLNLRGESLCDEPSSLEVIEDITRYFKSRGKA